MAYRHFAFMAVLSGLALSSVASSEVTRIDVAEQRTWVGGKAFGEVGAYELIRGTAHYEVDPNGPSGQGIADIELAPRNAQGLVEFSGPFLMLRPADPAKANGATVVEIANRGGTQMNYGFFTADSFKLPDPGDPQFRQTTIFDLGYTVAWVGWQGDLNPDQFGLSVPTGTGEGPVRLVFDSKEAKAGISLNDPDHYCAKGENARAVVRPLLTLKDRGEPLDPSWFSFSADGCTLKVRKPLDARYMYEIIYDGAPARVMGVGQAAVRDFGAHLKGRGTASVLNQRADARQLLAYGYSQSGRFLRDYLYRGFNADAGGQKVYDGMIIAAAGAGRGSFNHRYAMPGEAGNSVLSVLRAVDLYPFAETSAPDIDGSGMASAVDRSRAQGVMPKVMHTFSSTEYWARIGSLLTVSPDGRTELPLATESRLYYFAGTPHSPGFGKPEAVNRIAPFRRNYNDDMFFSLNALLVDLQAWVRDGTEPPPSLYPHPGDTLVPQQQVRFPKLPGVHFPVSLPPVWQIDFGPDYATKGIIANEPPKVGIRYPLLVPQVDADGNELGGYRGVVTAVPLGTYTAWTPPEPDVAGLGYLSGLSGGFLPFARTRAEREATGDPRLSVEERYGDRAGYEAAVQVAADKAVAERMMLPQEREILVKYLGRVWEAIYPEKAQ
ncbi:hypothetical protein ABAC460_00300 [Asticcacaulis sp. AC460]|uniref:alpha/beta hydrolase domain-containing protein n=1 Tax=Asticcacaulis sp. AC460 TaxID=1282360 RepID=UPI0003C3E4A0|nr:alpha/beta hydrolase domain-containing protein [Asticcacaulis sp. AC460]ESQ93542.1 hypothetical protein ABAC460_00300 [Asticcacaulis sp. AC460]